MSVERLRLCIAAGCYACITAAGQSLALFPGEEPQIRILPSFRIRVEPSPAEIPDLGSSVALHRSTDGSVVARRIVADAADDVYFAYELSIEPAFSFARFRYWRRSPKPLRRPT
jgi:hypothetical protein